MASEPKPIAIGIAGGSCSGKTTLALALRSALGEAEALAFAQDDYFYGLSDAPKGQGGANFDHPRAVRFALLAEHLATLKRGEAVQRPSYDFTVHLPRESTVPTVPRPVIIVDGTLILHDPATRDQLDFSVFVAAKPEVRLARRIARDVAERGRTAESVRHQFAEHVEPMHQQFVVPSAVYADRRYANDGQGDDWAGAIVAEILAFLCD